MPFYTLLGWQLGVLEWVLLWQAPRSDRTTYQLFTPSYVLILATGALLWS